MHSTAQHSTAQHSTAQHSTAQHSTAQHNTEGNNLERFELEQGQDFYTNSYYGSVKMNHTAFKIMFIAHSKNGEMIQRLLPRVIKPQQFELKLSAENNNLTLTPNEEASVNVILKNSGENQAFTVVVTDDKKFVTSFSPSSATIAADGTLNIKINFYVPADTSDTTTTSVSVSASIDSASTIDMVNFLSFELSVFSKVMYCLRYHTFFFIFLLSLFLLSPHPHSYLHRHRVHRLRV